MYKLKELQAVEEDKHLIPNLHVLAKALFGDNAYLTSKVPRQAHWATDKVKIGDGLLWLPWLRQLWLIEVEWKKDSNFFEQVGVFAEGKVNKERLRRELEEILEEEFGEVLTRCSSQLRLSPGVISENIIDQTLNEHISEGELRPHGWLILGHRDDRNELRVTYERALKRFFTGDKHYILSTARMFVGVGDFSSYILLEQYTSKGCSELIKVPPSILVPAVFRAFEMEKPVLEGLTVEEIPTSINKISQGLPKGRASQILAYLRAINLELMPEHIKLRIQVDEEHIGEYSIDWDHSGSELMVMTKQGIHQKPANAFKEEFPDLKSETLADISRKYGTFTDVSRTPPEEIARYYDVERHLRPKKKEEAATYPQIALELIVQERENYFSSITAHKQKKIRDNILNRRELCEVFLEKKKMTPAEFKRLSRFRPGGITGFMHFLTRNEIATRVGDVFILNEAVIPEIQRLLRGSPY